MTTSFIYFDFGKVLCDFSHDKMCAQMGEVIGMAPNKIQEILFHGQFQWQFEAGKLNSDAYFEELCKATKVRPDRSKLEQAACDIFSPMPSMHALLEEITATDMRLGVLSNTNPVHWNFVIESKLLPIAPQRLDEIVLSYEEVSMKPDPKIYKAATQRAGVPANEIFFTDDRPENIEGAIEFGLDAVLFESAEQLRGELTKRGVLG